MFLTCAELKDGPEDAEDASIERLLSSCRGSKWAESEDVREKKEEGTVEGASVRLGLDGDVSGKGSKGLDAVLEEVVGLGTVSEEEVRKRSKSFLAIVGPFTLSTEIPGE